MNPSSSLYDELRPDIAALALPLFEVSQRFLKARSNFLPHGAVLTEDGNVNLVMAGPENDLTNSTEVLPLLHSSLRRSAQMGVKALAVAENVTITLQGENQTDAIKVLVEHKRGLVVALYLPFKKRLLFGHQFGESFTVAATGEVNAWDGQDP